MVAICNFVLLFGLFLIAWTDAKSKRIPNQLLIVLAIFRTFFLIMECIDCHERWLTVVIPYAVGVLWGGGIFFFVYLFGRWTVGAGDVKLLAIVGYYLGSRSVCKAVFLMFMSAAVYGVSQMILKKKGIKEEMPFAPFTFVGTVFTMILY